MKALIVIAIILPAFCGCETTTGTTSAPSFNQLVLTAATLNDTVINTTDALVKSKTLTSTQATSILAVTDKVQAALTLANTAYSAGNQTTANAKLIAASAAIAGAQACLAGTPANLIVCLQGVTAP